MAIDVVGFWFFVFLILIAVLALPAWPYTRDRRFYRNDNHWRYAPSVAAALLAVLIVLLFWLGLLAVWWPWNPTVP